MFLEFSSEFLLVITHLQFCSLKLFIFVNFYDSSQSKFDHFNVTN